ncbi:hypothetical protein [Parvicella tangerina]|uniref:Uncharacterized protein n=1 Tax=Parvicella tangerina TaxID=2829795 RepID=A0A916JQV3_9FLAO|nr:hypothetical protein [Parvicella tangerina]CAG5087670.1 hypothetical protein CRYO30217_03543 [Parvicella tangerina]
MAKAKGIFKVKGKIGDLVFFIKNGEQHIKLAETQKGKRMKAYDKNDKRVITNNVRTGLNYYATSIHRIMKLGGVNIGRSQFNTLMNHIYYGMINQLRGRPTIRASEVKKVVHGFQWKNNHLGYEIFIEQNDEGILIQNASTKFLEGLRTATEKYQINIFKIELDDLTWNGEKYNYTLPGKVPAFIQQDWLCTAEEPSIQIALENIKDNEFIIVSVLPLIDAYYPSQSGASVWVF